MCRRCCFRIFRFARSASNSVCARETANEFRERKAASGLCCDAMLSGWREESIGSESCKYTKKRGEIFCAVEFERESEKVSRIKY